MDGALAGEPPIRPFADKALRAGIKARRRVLSAAGSMAVAAVIAVAIPVAAGSLGTPPASRQQPAGAWPFSGSANVPPPDKAVLSWPAVKRDQGSIVKITGETKTTCNRGIVKVSGFVISPQHVLTSAYAVAGMTIGPYVHDGTGNRFPAKVVLFDWNTYVAILYVPHLNAPPLSFTGPAPRGSDAVVAGYPMGGAFRAVPARVGSRWSAQGPNYYTTGTVSRAIYAVRASVIPGTAGGPLLAKSGKVYGVIFASSSAARDTGFALAASAVGLDVRHGAGATTPVSFSGCPPPRTIASPSPAPQSPP
jgi:S1-C subfamily serine protease